MRKKLISYIKKDYKNENGAIYVLSALIMFFLLAFVALVIDVGVMLLNIQENQGVTDAASRAALISGGEAGEFTKDGVLILNRDVADKTADITVNLYRECNALTNNTSLYIEDEDYNDNHNTYNYNHGLYDLKVTFEGETFLNLFDMITPENPDNNYYTFKNHSLAEARIYKSDTKDGKSPNDKYKNNEDDATDSTDTDLDDSDNVDEDGDEDMEEGDKDKEEGDEDKDKEEGDEDEDMEDGDGDEDKEEGDGDEDMEDGDDDMEDGDEDGDDDGDVLEDGL